ncbi:MAG: DoxX family protein [Bacteroidaceae bacterium]|nr:DoxX family protein [Bacteroidaceae bacterium]
MYRKILFPSCLAMKMSSALLLLARVCVGSLFLLHGMSKWMAYAELSSTFPDPLHIGSAWSLILIIIAELVCSVFFIFGLLYRVVLLPMIFAMGMAFFVIHDGSLDGGELSLVYMLIFVFLYLTGPGRYSIDAWLVRRWEEENAIDPEESE